MTREEELKLQTERWEAQEKKREALATMLISSGFNFDGYRIVKYSGYISGDDVIQIERGRQGLITSPNDVGEALMKSLSQMRRNALKELKEAAYALGCNAVIGVDFDYITFAPETANFTGGTTYLPYVFGVTANGNAVIIEKRNFEEQNELLTDLDIESRQHSIQFEKSTNSQNNNALIVETKNPNSMEDITNAIADIFITTIKDVTTIEGIMRVWDKFGLDIKCPAGTRFLSDNKRTEETFGHFTGTQLEDIKANLKKLLLDSRAR